MKKDIIAIIPARSGSKRLPNKNFKLFSGKPLVSWAISFAQQSNLINKIILTTDNEEFDVLDDVLIHRRPAKLAQDQSTVLDIVWQLVDDFDLDDDSIIVILMPTGPLRLQEDLVHCIDEFEQSENKHTVFTVGFNPQPPGILWLQDEKKLLHPFKERDKQSDTQKQNHLPTYFFNDLILLDSVSNFCDRKRDLFGPSPIGVISPPERSIPIDYPYQFYQAEWQFKNMERDYG